MKLFARLYAYLDSLVTVLNRMTMEIERVGYNLERMRERREPLRYLQIAVRLIASETSNVGGPYVLTKTLRLEGQRYEPLTLDFPCSGVISRVYVLGNHTECLAEVKCNGVNLTGGPAPLDAISHLLEGVEVDPLRKLFFTISDIRPSP